MHQYDFLSSPGFLKQHPADLKVRTGDCVCNKTFHFSIMCGCASCVCTCRNNSPGLCEHRADTLKEYEHNWWFSFSAVPTSKRTFKTAISTATVINIDLYVMFTYKGTLETRQQIVRAAGCWLCQSEPWNCILWLSCCENQITPKNIYIYNVASTCVMTYLKGS